MSTPQSPVRTRRSTRAALWIVILATAFGVFLTGMISTGMALAYDPQGIESPHGVVQGLVLADSPQNNAR